MFIMQVLASQLQFLAGRNPGVAIPPLFWPANCIKIGGHVALLSDPTACSFLTQQKMNNLFQVDENSIEQCFAAHIVLGC